MEFLSKNKTAIFDLCKQYKVKNLFAFGSVLTEKFRDDSDVDFVVEFELLPPLEYANYYFDFKFSLEDLLKRKIDLLEIQAIRNQNLKKRIDETKSLVYAG
jgi:uncharacterized protein